MTETSPRTLAAWARHEKHAYTGGEERPLGSFLALMAAYGTGAGALAGVAKARGRQLPERIPWADIALITAGTSKLARLVAKDPVTSPLRAPFTTFDGTSGEAELQEQVRGSGPRKAIGELITCPFCLAQWVATGMAFGYVLSPRATRLVATVFTAVLGADVIQLLYAKTQDWATS